MTYDDDYVLMHKDGKPGDLAGAREWHDRQALRTAQELRWLYDASDEDTQPIIVRMGPVARLKTWLRRMWAQR